MDRCAIVRYGQLAPVQRWSRCFSTHAPRRHISITIDTVWCTLVHANTATQTASHKASKTIKTHKILRLLGLLGLYCSHACRPLCSWHGSTPASICCRCCYFLCSSPPDPLASSWAHKVRCYCPACPALPCPSSPRRAMPR